MKTLEVGQRATIKSDLIEGQIYGSFRYCKEMSIAILENNTIERVKNTRVNFLNNKWNYDISMF